MPFLLLLSIKNKKTEGKIIKLILKISYLEYYFIYFRINFTDKAKFVYCLRIKKGGHINEERR